MHCLHLRSIDKMPSFTDHKVADDAMKSFKVVFGSDSFSWDPPASDDDWDESFEVLREEIKQHFPILENLANGDITLQDQDECDIDDGDDLKERFETAEDSEIIIEVITMTIEVCPVCDGDKCVEWSGNDESQHIFD